MKFKLLIRPITFAAICLGLLTGAPALADINSVYEHLKTGQYKLAAKEVLRLHDAGNLQATHIIGLMYYHGWGVTINDNTAAAAFKAASDGGVPDAAYYLARSFLLESGSPHYNFDDGMRLLEILEASNHKNGTFYHGIMQFKNFELAPNQAQALARTRQSFEKAEALGKIDSKFFLYLIEREEIDIGQRSNYTTIKKLIEAAEIQNDSQAMAAFTLALLYKKGVALPKDLGKYMLHLRVSADLGLANAALLLGKALSIGVLNDPDYEEARFYLELAQKKEMKGADFLLSQLENQEKREQAANSYQAPKFWQEHLWAAQAFSGLPSSDIEKDEASSDIFSSGEWRSNKVVDLPTMVRFRQTGKNIYGSDGSRYRIRGDTIRSSDGTRFKVKGDSIRASNGVRYKIRGKTIRGSDGTRCRISGKYTRCY